MILSNHTILDRLDDLVEHPEYIDVEAQVQPASLDIRIGPELFDQHRDKMVQPRNMMDGQTHDLVPDKPYLGHTVEVVTLPNDVAALMTGRSSLARRNVIVHQTAGWVDPGFEGELTFEILNFGDDVEQLRVGERVAQLVFFVLDQPSDGYAGQYQGQRGITTAHDD